MKLLNISILSALAAYVVADDRFKSRPDLTIPVWNISSLYNNEKSKLSTDYVFVTPYSVSTPLFDEAVEQPGAYIYTAEGDLVWSSFSYFGGVSLNFQAATIDGEPAVYAFEGQFLGKGGHGHGHIKFLDDHYNVKKEIRGGDHKFIDIHEFHLVDNNKHGLVESYSPVEDDLSQYNEGDSKRKWVVNAIVQEIDVSTNELLFEWKSLDHVSPAHSVLNLTGGLAGDGYTSGSSWDYFHINSVDKNEDGDYLISSRHTSAIYKINGKSGDIIWRLSTSGESDLEIVGDDFNFSFQHHARFIERLDDGVEIISFFDNNAYSIGHSDPESEDPDNFSSGKIIKVDNKHKTVKLLKQYNPPSEHPVSAKSQGSFQFLSNGNKFINWGSAGAITEFDEDGKVLFFAKLESGVRQPYVQSYRAFKYPWSGYSPEDIAVASETDKKGDTTVYVSWNGDTQTKKWQIVDANSKKVIATFDKTGFESSYSIDTSIKAFYVSALDENKESIKNSATIGEVTTNSLLDYFSWRQIVLQ